MKIETPEQLRQHYKEPKGRAVQKQLEHLDVHCRNFIALSPFLILASSSEGSTDASPRGGAPGFVRVPDPHTLLVPDWPGNNRLDSFANILRNPNIGTIFLIPGVDETLRINGTVEIRTDDALRHTFETNGKLPVTVLKLTVKEAYLHCAKAFMRAKLWREEAKIDRAALPTTGTMLKDQTGSEGPAETQEAMLERYQKILY